MTEASGPLPTSRPYNAPVGQAGRPQPANLADILERVLDKGIITNTAFTALLLMAVASTMLTVPMVTPLLKRLSGIDQREA